MLVGGSMESYQRGSNDSVYCYVVYLLEPILGVQDL